MNSLAFLEAREKSLSSALGLIRAPRLSSSRHFGATPAMYFLTAINAKVFAAEKYRFYGIGAQDHYCIVGLFPLKRMSWQASPSPPDLLMNPGNRQS